MISLLELLLVLKQKGVADDLPSEICEEIEILWVGSGFLTILLRTHKYINTSA